MGGTTIEDNGSPPPRRAPRGEENPATRAIRHARTALDLDPHFGMAHYFLGEALSASGQGDDAIAALKRAVEFTGGTAESRAALAQALATAGKHDAARATAAALAELERNHYVSPVLHARIAAAFGDVEEALTRLLEAYDARATDLGWVSLRPEFDSLRQHQTFVDLVARIGLSS